MRSSLLFIIILGSLGTTAMSSEVVSTHKTNEAKAFYGKASYYYGKWIGRKTANGEIYKRNDMTVAHKTLPFGTMVRVTNLNNNQAVVVRVNNRGPYVKGRVVDLSLAAAQEIQMTKSGVVPVKVEILAAQR